MPHHEFSAQYSEDLVRRSVRRHFSELIRRELSWALWFAVAVTAGTLAYGLLRGRASWLEGVAGTVLVLLPILIVLGYRAHLRQGLDKLRAMGSESAQFVLTDTGLTVSTRSGTSTIPWSQFAAILKGTDFWILRLRNRSTLTLPTNSVDASAREFIEAMIGTSRPA